MSRRTLQQALALTESTALLRRYFVVNGFDGALTMLGILSGFYLGEVADTRIVISACLGAAVALFMSGLSAAVISEAAERKRSLAEMEQAMGKSLQQSAHGTAARLTPWLVGAVNGLSPLCISLLILSPVFFYSPDMRYSPLLTAMSFGLICLFLLGIFLGRIDGSHWLLSGLKALFVGIFTLTIILLLE
ncbi:VIT1/CCC1 transporter family protein [Reinekea sp. G2M2-21]|uniref:VIT1/CCC1 transporter family protein n=1 Tax=Reinekea sp. G2M2-21 TaxID=2788942 RepID=UPI0018AAE184|nr:VIT1/CCC1 transporter family protein [Reinekea sp. G2M2-21]